MHKARAPNFHTCVKCPVAPVAPALRALVAKSQSLISAYLLVGRCRGSGAVRRRVPDGRQAPHRTLRASGCASMHCGWQVSTRCQAQQYAYHRSTATEQGSGDASAPSAYRFSPYAVCVPSCGSGWGWVRIWTHRLESDACAPETPCVLHALHADAQQATPPSSWSGCTVASTPAPAPAVAAPARNSHPCVKLQPFAQVCIGAARHGRQAVRALLCSGL